MESNTMHAETDHECTEADQGFTEVDQKCTEVDQGFTEVDQGFTEVDQKCTEVDHGSMEALFRAIETTLAGVRSDVREMEDRRRWGKFTLAYTGLHGAIKRHVWTDPVFVRLYPESKRDPLVQRIETFVLRWLGRGTTFLHGLKTCTPMVANKAKFVRSHGHR